MRNLDQRRDALSNLDALSVTFARGQKRGSPRVLHGRVALKAQIGCKGSVRQLVENII